MKRIRRVIGIVVVEPLQQAYLKAYSQLLQPSNARDSPMVRSEATVCDLTESRHQAVAQPAKLGVAVMWVSSEHRLKGLAQHMISIACSQPSGMFFQFIGCTHKQVAFLAPTDDGARFATKLRGDGQVLLYSRSDDSSESKESAERM
jgi:hypothetical protein